MLWRHSALCLRLFSLMTRRLKWKCLKKHKWREKAWNLREKRLATKRHLQEQIEREPARESLLMLQHLQEG